MPLNHICCPHGLASAIMAALISMLDWQAYTGHAGRMPEKYCSHAPAIANVWPANLAGAG